MSRRRVRFAVKCVPHGEGSLRGERVIDMLAYPMNPTDFGAWPGGDCGLPLADYQWFSRNVGQVLGVERVKRGEARRNASRSPLWKLNEAALQEVSDFFGLMLPVHIRRTAGRRTYGTYQLRMGGQLPHSVRQRVGVRPHGLYHHLTVSTRRSPELASRTLWHELAHATQAERVIDALPAVGVSNQKRLEAYWQANRADNSHRYKNRPWEIEARSYECYADEIAPCVAP